MAEGIYLMACVGCAGRLTLGEGQVEWWPSVACDAATGEMLDDGAEPPADTVRKPLCEGCIEKITLTRKALGLPDKFALYRAKRKF